MAVRLSLPVSGDGTVFTYTVNHQPFNPAVPVPYVIAIVEMAEQADLRIAANIVDCEPVSVYVGLPVEVRFERHAVDNESVFVPVFVPRANGQTALHVDIDHASDRWLTVIYAEAARAFLSSSANVSSSCSGE